MATFVLVPGSFHGGWAWNQVARLLRADGHDVHTPTLTGLGDRAHLMRPGVGLATHVDDLAGLVWCEDLADVVIVAHSYAGMPVAGVVDRMPERFAAAVYIDALIPTGGASALDLLTPDFRDHFLGRATDEGVIPLADDALLRWGLLDHPLLGWARERMVAQPTAAFTEPLALRTPVEDAGPRPVYVYATVKPAADLFTGAAERARTAPGWTYREVDAPHDYMITHPELTAATLAALAP